jgi:multidrug resistance efflux pump
MRATQQSSVQRWLQQHCESSSQVAGGLVIAMVGREGQALNAAQWPPNGAMTPTLAAAAHAAVQRARPVVVAPAVAEPDARHNRVISIPLRSGDVTLGAVALAVQVNDGNAVNTIYKDLAMASATIGDGLARAPAKASESDAARVLDLQDTLLRHDTLADGALAMLTELVALLGSDRVVLGVAEHDRFNVLAVSGSADFKHEQELMRLTAAAMQEASYQSSRVVYPAPAAETPRIVLAHAELHARSAHTTATVPLYRAGKPVGALLSEWRADQVPTDDKLALMDSVGAMLGPVVSLSRRAERSWIGRTQDALRAGWARMTQRNDPVPKVFAVLLVSILIAVVAIPVDYRIGAPARVEGAVQRVLAAPMDGFLHKSHVRPGDTVKTGDLLVELAGQDLLLELRRWEGALNQHENAVSAALARSDRAQFVVAHGKAAEARAQLELVRQQLQRTRLVAPIDGVVIKGDLNQSLGAPVQKGEALLTLAPAERHRLIVDVDERDVSDVQVGQTGHLALAAMPSQPLPFVIERVTPVSAVRNGRNAFEVEARLTDDRVPLRPGLQGVARIDAGQQTTAWIWSHRAVDAVRLTLWSWMP